MPPVEHISQSSQAFFSSCVSLAFAVFVTVRAAETLRHFPLKSEDYRHLRGVALLSALGTLAGALPLILSESKHCLLISSAVFLFAASLLYIGLLWELQQGLIVFIYKPIAIPLTVSALPFLVLLGLNALSLLDAGAAAIAYKSALGWLMLLIGARVYLVIGHMLSQRSD
jgi:hypothetical protein